MGGGTSSFCFFLINPLNREIFSSKLFQRKRVFNFGSLNFQNLVDTEIRCNAFLNVFSRKGKRLRGNILLLKVLWFLQQKFCVRHIYRFFGFILSTLEPFFELRSAKKFGRVVLVPFVISKSKKAFLAAKFLLQGVCLLKRQEGCTILQSLVRELLFIVKGDERLSKSLKLKRIFSKQLLKVKTFKKFVKTNVIEIS